LTRVNLELLYPEWPAPARVRAFATTRAGGGSVGPYASLNLGDHVGDAAAAVAANRRLVQAYLPAEPLWLRQVHGVAVADAGLPQSGPPEADAAVARHAGQVCVVLTADCLPVLFCDTAGQVVAAAHAGWRGLLSGVLERTVDAMRVPPSEVLAWLGPAIGPTAFEVGEDVREAFIMEDRLAASAFLPGAVAGKWWADLPALARWRLARKRVTQVYGGTLCTYGDAEHFYSYRRDGVTGRLGSFIWLA
jgi:purine-nucleoside/S-methyl-5'-thioadenosine phosphorylase / adenosine deaminase